MTQPQSEKRRFSRVPFDAEVVLNQDGHQWQTRLLDISLNGVLVERPQEWAPSNNDHFTLELTLSESGTLITGEVSIAHTEENRIGFHMVNIDVESVAHLRRLMELNLGDPELMDRELSALHWR